MDTTFTLPRGWTPSFPRAFFQHRTHAEMSLLYTKYLLNIMSRYHPDKPWTVSVTFRTNQNRWGSKNRTVSVLLKIVGRLMLRTMPKNHKVPRYKSSQGTFVACYSPSLSLSPLSASWRHEVKNAPKAILRTTKQNKQTKTLLHCWV